MVNPCTVFSHPPSKISKSKSLHSSANSDASNVSNSKSSSSAFSSGFWEDSESLTRSLNEEHGPNSQLTDVLADPHNKINILENKTLPPYKRKPNQFDPTRVIPKDLSLTAHGCLWFMEDLNESLNQDPFIYEITTTANVAQHQIFGRRNEKLFPSKNNIISYDALSSDSEDEFGPTNYEVEPKSRFEAALRRCHQRHQVFQTQSVGLPDWGSPILLAKASRHTPSGLMQNQERLDVKIESRNASFETIFDLSDGISRPESPQSGYSKDWCGGMESWLKRRSQSVYTAHRANVQSLQLCFINQFDQDFQSRESTVERELMDSTNKAFPRLCSDGEEEDVEEYPESGGDSQLTVLQPQSLTTNDVISSTTGVETNLRDRNASAELIDRLNELDRFYRLYLEQTISDCEENELQMMLSKRKERQKHFHAKTLLALSQLPKIARMQTEIEKYQWFAVSEDLSDLLSVKMKPRSVLPVATFSHLTKGQLKLIVNDLYKVLDVLNAKLVDELTQRDELHLEQGARLIELDDLSAYFKELCVRASIRHFRRKVSMDEPNTYRFSVPSALPLEYLHIPNLNERLSSDNVAASHSRKASRKTSVGQRFFTSLFGRRSTS